MQGIRGQSAGMRTCHEHAGRGHRTRTAGENAGKGSRIQMSTETSAPPRHPRRLWRNRLTLAGASLTLLALLFILSLLFFDLVSPEPSPYIGLFAFLVAPGFVVLGFGLVALGFVLARRRVRRINGVVGQVQYYPRIDLNLESHRRVLLIAGAIVAAAVPFIGFMSYEGYEYTDSNEFCGQVCHTVMQPQYTAHEAAAHARVECADCHIGRGASWYVKSKISGLRQVWAVATDSFDRPIPPAIRELRPARETCEQCHWPEKFFGDQLITIHRYAPDEKSTERVVRMLMRTGGSDPTEGPPSGIHWHMALQSTIEFVAIDHELQEIPWIRSTDNQTGRTVVYRSDGLGSRDPAPVGTRRKMDCMDCHNRATHVFRPPSEAADLVLHVDPKLRELPFAKRELVSAVVQPYPSREEAMVGVEAVLRSFYEDGRRDVVSRKAAEVDRLVAAARDIVHRSDFPAMKVDWRTYPDNIGHKNFAGCFRCHDGRHVDDDGRPISRDCATCHEFLEPSHAGDAVVLARSEHFDHPMELEGKHATMRCNLCHTGGVAPATTCEGCHADTTAFRAGALEALAGFEIGADPMEGLLGCTDCHDLSEPLDVDTMQALCSACHDEAGFEHIVAEWKATAKQLLAAAESGAGPRERKIIEAIRRAGPLHNMNATVEVLTALTGLRASADSAPSRPR